MSSYGLDCYKTDFKVFYFAIASSEAMELLKDVVDFCRRPLAETSVVSGFGYSSAQRIEEIERLDQNVCYLGLLRRCHVLHLVQDYEPPQNGFITATLDSLSNPTSPKLGNPLHRATAAWTREILRQTYPGLQDTSADYQKRYRTVNGIRKLGYRLKLLTSKFGIGIIGLLPLRGGPTTEGYLTITDEMMLSLSEKVFENIVLLLDQCQGGVLRDISSAMEDLVLNIYNGHFDRSRIFAIDRVERSQMARYPKGSRELLKALEVSPLSEASI
ncbi:MAG: hypothetical protein M1825_004062 [Sarcosagium campestre]|nr:MAG: hypothetical protein M1825_004062 [Sarcosagium campestre]